MWAVCILYADTLCYYNTYSSDALQFQILKADGTKLISFVLRSILLLGIEFTFMYNILCTVEYYAVGIRVCVAAYSCTSLRCSISKRKKRKFRFHGKHISNSCARRNIRYPSFIPTSKPCRRVALLAFDAAMFFVDKTACVKGG